MISKTTPFPLTRDAFSKMSNEEYRVLISQGLLKLNDINVVIKYSNRQCYDCEMRVICNYKMQKDLKSSISLYFSNMQFRKSSLFETFHVNRKVHRKKIFLHHAYYILTL